MPATETSSKASSKENMSATETSSLFVEGNQVMVVINPPCHCRLFNDIEAVATDLCLHLVWQ
jgi:hypothetical protein